MPAYYDEKRKQWRYRFRGKIAGIKVTLSGTPASNTKRAAEAEERIAIEQRRRELEAPQLYREVPTLEEWADSWLERSKRDHAHGTYHNRESAMRVHWYPLFRNRLIDQISKAEIEEYLDKLMAQGYSGATVRNLGRDLVTCLRDALKSEIIDRVPIAVRMPPEPRREDFLDTKTTTTLYAACRNTEERVAVLLGVRAGLRHGEIRGVQWGDLDFETRTLRVQRQVGRDMIKLPKRGKKRVVPLHEDLVLALDTRWRDADQSIPWVLHRRGQPFSEDTLDLLLDRVVKRVEGGITIERHGKQERLNWHALRHTCASHMAQAGVPLQKIGAMLGHSSTRTTERYAHLCPTAILDAVDILPSIKPAITPALPSSERAAS